MATFRVPDDYVLYVSVNEWPGDGGRGFQYSWTNGEVRCGCERDREREYSEKFIEVNGLRLHYLVWGNADKPPFIPLHGIARPESARHRVAVLTGFDGFASSTERIKRVTRVVSCTIDGSKSAMWRYNAAGPPVHSKFFEFTPSAPHPASNLGMTAKRARVTTERQRRGLTAGF